MEECLTRDRPRGRGFEPHRRHWVVSLSKNINPSLVLVQPRKTHPCLTERLLMGRKESNQSESSSTLFLPMDNLKVCNQFGLRPRGYKTFSYSTQLSMKFNLLINVKMPTIVGILKTYAAISNAQLSRVCKRGKLSGSCLSTLNGFGSTQLPIFLCHIRVPTFSSRNN